MRAEILRQISSANADLSGALAQIPAGDASRVQIALQLANLSALRQQVGVASEAALQRMQAEVTATIAAAQNLSSADLGSASGAGTAATLAAVSAKARNTVQSFASDFFEKRLFDKYLEFTSDDDEKAYREREKVRQKEIQEALALKTRAGEQRALELAKEQLEDAGAHGADRSPEYSIEETKLDTTSKELNAAVVAAADGPKLPPQADGHAASLQRAGVTVADQTQQGHGVVIDASIARLLGRA